MSRSSDNDREPLVSLVCEIDEQIGLEQDSVRLITKSALSLDPDQLEELREAEKALQLLQRVRRNMNVLQNLGREI